MTTTSLTMMVANTAELKMVSIVRLTGQNMMYQQYAMKNAKMVLDSTKFQPIVIQERKWMVAQLPAQSKKDITVMEVTTMLLILVSKFAVMA